MNNVMVDLETLGTVPGCSILSIGAIAFDHNRKELGPKFYTVISRPSCIDIGLREDEGTLYWWKSQSPEACRVLEQAEASYALPIREALELFANYLQPFNHRTVCVWGNGSDFDNAILAYAYHQIGSSTPWNFRNNRCFRTFKAMFNVGAVPAVGTHHNALDDAIYQCHQLFSVFP